MENPSIVNPYLVQSINLRTGAFPVNYGDKLSSVLDITYQSGNHERIAGMANLSTLKAGFSLEGSIGKEADWILAARKINYGYLLDAHQTRRDYTPDSADFQFAATWFLSPRSRMRVLGIYANSDFKLNPERWVTGLSGFGILMREP